MAANRNHTCHVMITVATVCGVSVYIYEKIEQFRKKNLTKQTPEMVGWYTYLFGGGSVHEETDHVGTSRLPSEDELVSLIQEDVSWIYYRLVDVICIFIPRNITSVTAAVVILIATVLYYHQNKKAKKKGKRKKDVEKRRSISQFVQELSYAKLAGTLTVCAFLCSIPWEYIRLYQTEVAKRAAVMQAGTPQECQYGQLSLLQSIKYWFLLQLSWQHNPCDKYYRALLVDPVWEISPLMVLSSAVTRCVLHPLEILFEGVGKCLRLFFNEIPVQWQPVMFMFLTVIVVLLLVMQCGYRIHLPFLLRFEPKTPVLIRLTNQGQGDMISGDSQQLHRNIYGPAERKKLSYTMEGPG